MKDLKNNLNFKIIIGNKQEENIKLLRGMCYAYGIIAIRELFKIYSKFDNSINLNGLKKILVSDIEIVNNFKIEMFDLDEELPNVEFLVYRKIPKKNILKGIVNIYAQKALFSKSEYLDYAESKLDINNKYYKNLIDNLKFYCSDNKAISKFEEIFFEVLNYEENVFKIEQYLFDILVNKNTSGEKVAGKDFVKIKKILLKCTENMPSWRIGSYTAKKYELLLERMERLMEFSENYGIPEEELVNMLEKKSIEELDDMF